MIARRSFLAGLFVAPAIVRASSLMAIKPIEIVTLPYDYAEALRRSFMHTKAIVAAQLIENLYTDQPLPHLGLASLERLSA